MPPKKGEKRVKRVKKVGYTAKWESEKRKKMTFEELKAFRNRKKMWARDKIAKMTPDELIAFREKIRAQRLRKKTDQEEIDQTKHDQTNFDATAFLSKSGLESINKETPFPTSGIKNVSPLGSLSDNTPSFGGAKRSAKRSTKRRKITRKRY